MTNLPATTTGAGAVEGLEDFDESDSVVPQIRINHSEGVFENNLTNEQYDELNCVVLGLVKQRVLWDAEISDTKEFPLCRSYDFKLGYPSKDEDGDWRFPWGASGFEETEDLLPCASCKLKDWGSHPTRDAPWCAEQHTLIVAIPQGEEGGFSCALLVLQRSAVKPSKTYISGFATSGTPMFTAFTKIGLEGAKKGSTKYSVPKFSKTGETEAEMHPAYSESYRRIRAFVQTPYVRKADDEETSVSEPSAPSTPAASAPSTGGITGSAAPAAAGSDDGDDDELPF